MPCCLIRKHPWAFDYKMQFSDSCAENPTMGFLGQMIPCRNKFAILLLKNSWLEFHGNRPLGSRSIGETMRCCFDRKSPQMQFFAAVLRPIGREDQSLQCHLILRFPEKISSQSVPICRSYSRKVISYDRSIGYTFAIEQLHVNKCR